MYNYELLKNRSIFQISGDNSAAFLMRITTNVLPKAGSAVYSMMLNSCGKFLFDFFIINNNNKFLIDCLSASANDLLQKLNIYNFRSEVRIEDVSESYAVLYSIVEDLDFSANIIIQYKDSRFNQLGFRFLIKRSNNSQPINIPNIGESLYYKDKYRLTIPDGYIDLLPAKSFPLEYGSDALNAISYSKGCYIGQEIISRTKYQGMVRKRIYRAVSNSDISNLASCTSIIDNDGNIIGQLCSSYHNHAIVLIRDGNNVPYYYDKEHAQVGGSTIQLHIPPWCL